MSAKRQNTAQERVIEHLRTAIFDGKCGLSDVPELIKRVVKEDLWQQRTLPRTGATVVFGSFEEFLRISPPEGLGTDYKTLRRLCAGDVETLDLLEQTLKVRKQGGDRRSQNFKDDNVNFELAKKGNSVEYSLKRLKRERPDLHRQIIEGKLSVNRAMIEAGYRKQPLQITTDLEKTAAALKTVFSPSQLKQLISLLRQSV